MGMVEISVAVTPDHVSALNAFAELLRTSVVTGSAPPMVPHPDDVSTINTMISMLGAERGAAPPPAPAAFDPYPMWVSIHGQEVADQMREAGV